MDAGEGREQDAEALPILHAVKKESRMRSARACEALLQGIPFPWASPGGRGDGMFVLLRVI